MTTQYIMSSQELRVWSSVDESVQLLNVFGVNISQATLITKAVKKAESIAIKNLSRKIASISRGEFDG